MTTVPCGATRAKHTDLIGSRSAGLERVTLS
jgi:hypothetical protein